MRIRAVSMEYLVDAFRNNRTMTDDELERLVTNGAPFLTEEEYLNLQSVWSLKKWAEVGFPLSEEDARVNA